MLPSLHLKKKNKWIAERNPWLLEADINPTSEMMLEPPGSLVQVVDATGKKVAVGYYNALSSIACRILSFNANEVVDAAFFHHRLKTALARRERMISLPYYRLVHAEADGLPGLIIDRFGDKLVCQIGTAGMERLWPHIVTALEELLHPEIILLRNDIPSRSKEGLRQEVRLIKGELAGFVEVYEYDTIYWADLVQGQKTGWFYDQRDNRKLIASYASGKTMLDVYCHSGGFGLAAAKAGAASVTFADSSAPALAMARQAAPLNGVEARCDYIEGRAYEVLADLGKQKRLFDIVMCDPPAFIKSYKDRAAGLKGYEKLAQRAAALVAPGGILCVASCSHHAGKMQFFQAVKTGTKKAGRDFAALHTTGASPDHPVHPQLPQSEYLKAITLRLD